MWLPHQVDRARINLGRLARLSLVDALYVFFILKRHLSCEIDFLVENHICKLRAMLRSRVLRGASTWF